MDNNDHSTSPSTLPFKVKTLYFKTPSGDLLPLEELAKKVRANELPYGIYVSEDKITLTNFVAITPQLSTGFSSKNLNWAIENIHRYSECKQEYAKLIKEDSYVKWFLIPCLLMHKEHAELITNLSPIPASINHNELVKNKGLFKQLNQQGAEYKHYLIGSANCPDIGDNYFGVLLNLFGSDAYTLPGSKQSLLNLVLSRHGDEAFTKIAYLLISGANINQVVDETTGNTALHHQIFSENRNDLVLKLMHFAESMSLSSEFVRKTTKNNDKLNWEINYSQQNKAGMTPLWMATAMGVEEVVLWMLKRESPEEFGINICDNESRSPLLVAAILGRTKLLSYLIAGGANIYIKDNQNRDLNYWCNIASDDEKEAEARKILSSCSIIPERGVGLNGNYLCSTNGNFHPLVTLEGNDEIPIVLSPQSPYKEKLNMVMGNIKSLTDNSQDSPFNKKLMFVQFSNFVFGGEKNTVEQLTAFNQNPDKISNSSSSKNSIKTVIQECQENQPQIKKIINKTLLHHACLLGEIETIKKLILEKKVDVTQLDFFKQSLLSYTIMDETILRDTLNKQGLQGKYNVTTCISKQAEVFKFLWTNCKSLQPHIKASLHNPIFYNLAQDFYTNTEQPTGIRAKEILKTILLPSQGNQFFENLMQTACQFQNNNQEGFEGKIARKILAAIIEPNLENEMFKKLVSDSYFDTPIGMASKEIVRLIRLREQENAAQNAQRPSQEDNANDTADVHVRCHQQ